MTTKFNITKYTAIFSEKGKVNIAPGCTYNLDEDPQVLTSFNCLAMAKAQLRRFKSDIRKYDAWGGGREYKVTEYCVTEEYYGEDGEWQDHNGVHEWSQFNIEIVAGYNDEPVMKFADMRSAMCALDAYQEMWPDSYIELNGQWGGTWDGNVKVVNFSGDIMDIGTAVSFMDDELREEVHRRVSPCLPQEFFNEYCRAHQEKFKEEFMSI